MVEAVNAERGARGLPPYRVAEKLALLARRHSQDMVARGYFDHTTPEGVTLRDRVNAAGINAHWIGENIQRNSRAGEEAISYAVQWFMQSEPHRNNILHQHYTHIGVGAVQDQAGMTTFTLVFAGLALDPAGVPTPPSAGPVATSTDRSVAGSSGDCSSDGRSRQCGHRPDGSHTGSGCRLQRSGPASPPPPARST